MNLYETSPAGRNCGCRIHECDFRGNRWDAKPVPVLGYRQWFRGGPGYLAVVHRVRPGGEIE